MSHSQLHSGIDILLGRNTLLKKHDCLIDHRHKDSIGDESRVVITDCNSLAASLSESLGAAKSLGRSLHCWDDFTELHLWDGVEEVDSDDAGGGLAVVFGLACCAGQAGDTDGRGVGAENCWGWELGS